MAKAMNGSKKLRLDSFFPYRLSIASNAISDVISNAYRALFGLTIPEWRLIAILGEKRAATQFALGGATRMDKLTVSRAAARLVRRALLERGPNLEDKRSNVLSLTPAGHALYDQVAPKALAIEKALLEEFTEEEINHLITMLLRLEKAATRLDQKADSNAA